MRHLHQCLYALQQAPSLHHPHVPALPSLDLSAMPDDPARSGPFVQYGRQFFDRLHVYRICDV